MKKRKLDKNKILTYTLFIAITIIFFLSIASYNPSDPVGLFQNFSKIKAQNLFNNLGATIAAPIFEKTFGYGALVFPLLILFFIYANYKKISLNLIIDFSAKILLLGLWIGLFLALPQSYVSSGKFTSYFPSGEFSAKILKILFQYTGTFGTIFIILVLFLLFILWILKDVTILLKILKAIKLAILFIVKSLMYYPKKIYRNIKFKKFYQKFRKNINDEKYIIETDEDFSEENNHFSNTENEIKSGLENESEKNNDELSPIEKKIAEKFKSKYEEIEPFEIEPDDEQDIIEVFPKQELETKVKEDKIKNEQPQTKHNPILLKRVQEEMDKQQDLNFEIEEQHIDREVKIENFITNQLKKYKFPSVDLLDFNDENEKKVTREELEFNAKLLVDTLSHFSVEAKLVKVMEGPVVTQYQLKPAQGVKISKIVSLQDDLALALKARGIRIIAPIPGKSAVGVEIPNRNRSIVYLKNVISSESYMNFKGELPIVLGKMINGEIYSDDLTQMPHLLLAGATGTGKSVGLNVLIASILYRIPPTDVKFILIDPKRLEFSLYENLKNHYLAYCPELDEFVITEPDNAVLMLNSLILEMEKRYQMLKELRVRGISEYNNKIKNGLDENEKYVYEHKHLPYLVVIIDELADLMLSSAKEVEEPIARLTQKARAAGIHLILATQRPSVNVITGIIKANIPVRVAYQVPQKIDSKVILDLLGADQLIGKGDMLFKSPKVPKPIRIQTPLIDTHEVERLVKHIKKQPHFPPYELQLPAKPESPTGFRNSNSYIDPLFNEARQIVIMHQTGSASLLQRKLRIGYTRAASILDQMEEMGIVGPSQGSKARDVFIEKLDD